jgi:hypothetical protein
MQNFSNDVDAVRDAAHIGFMTGKSYFPSRRLWAGPAHRQALPIPMDCPLRVGDEVNVLAHRERSGATIVTITWRGENRAWLDTCSKEYSTPRAALEDGWELGEFYLKDAQEVERQARIYG